MKVLGLASLLIVGGLGYALITALDGAALAMAVGVVFGALSGIPVGLLVLASKQRPPAPQTRYRVLAGNSGPYVLDVATGATYAIVQPRYDIEVQR